jgi:zinc transport system substrate-binding protein
MRATAKAVAAALATLDPARKAAYQQRLASVLTEVAALDGDLRREFVSLTSRRFLVYHPAWAYLARDYGLQQVAIEAEGKEPSAHRLIDVADMARREKMGTVFVDRWSSDTSARAIAADLGARVVTLDPLAEDWPANLRRVGGALREALGG